jgi:hypothetical protein
MTGLPNEGTHLPDLLEEEVLLILEGEDAEFESRLRGVLDANPQHATAIRRWLASVGGDRARWGASWRRTRGRGNPTHAVG